MSRLERVRNLDSQRQNSLHRQRLARNFMLQRLALHEFHDDEGPAVLFADIVDRADIGMIQCGRGLRLTAKAQ